MLVPATGGGFVLAAELDVGLPSIADPAQAAALVRAAHRHCPYSKALRGNVDVAFTVNGLDLGSGAENPQVVRAGRVPDSSSHDHDR